MLLKKFEKQVIFNPQELVLEEILDATKDLQSQLKKLNVKDPRYSQQLNKIVNQYK